MEQLRTILSGLIDDLSGGSAEEIKERLTNLVSVFPFNEYEFMISSLLALDKLNLDDYFEMRDDYIARNMFLYLFEISSPRGFGEQWAQGHLMSLVPALVKPTKKLDSNYKGDYDLILPPDACYARIEVKASRAVNAGSSEPLYVKALARESVEPFWMNFQQIKPSHCDVFVWIAVWRDAIRYWILSSDEVLKHSAYSRGQHRGNVGEGQLHVRPDNITLFDPFEGASNALEGAISNAYAR